MTGPPLLDVAGLRVDYAAGAGAPVVDGVDLRLAPRVRCGLVGESGSGKSSIVKAILGLIRPPGQVGAERITLDGVGDLAAMSPRQLRRVRGASIGYIGQNPFGALHPVIPLGKQFEGFLRDHDHWHGARSMAEVSTLLAGLGIADPARVLRGHAGALSGGMAQRVTIALASLLQPSLLIADEPTTALDVTVQRQVLDLIAQPRTETAQSLLLVTHDLGVVAQYCDDVVVLRHGQIVEAGPVSRVFTEPAHAYTRSLLASVPGAGRSPEDRAAAPQLRVARAVPAAPAPPNGSDGAESDGGPDGGSAGGSAPAIRLDGVARTYSRGATTVAAVRGVSLRVERGETVALVGESGSGKSTLGRLATMLEAPDEGRVLLEGEEISGLSSRRLRRHRSRLQIVFQEPYQSLNPQLRAAASVAEPLANLRPRPGREEIDRRVRDAFELAGLDPAKGDRYPHQLSGGEQQRVGIARAIVTRPAFVVLDEPTSSLDLTVRAAIVAQLQALQDQLGIAYLFISHDLATARQIARRVAVMYRGQIVETGPADEVLARPQHPYTQTLSEACLDADPRVAPLQSHRRPVLAAEIPGGCPFLPRCERATEHCREDPSLTATTDARTVACHHPLGVERKHESTVQA